MSPEPKNMVCHIDGKRLNNRASNLKWGDQTDNQQDSIRHGTRSKSYKRLTPKQTAEIKSSDKTLAELSAIYGVTPVTISVHRHK